MVIPLFVGRPKSIKAMETAMEAGKSILLVAQKSAAKDDPGPGDMYAIGCVSNILQMLKLPTHGKVLVEGGSRAQIREIVDVRTHWVAESGAGADRRGDGSPAAGLVDAESELLRRIFLSADDVERGKQRAPHRLDLRRGAASIGTGTDSATSACARRRFRRICAREPPSTRTFTVPSGSFSICRMLETQPMAYIVARARVVLGGGFLRDQQDRFPCLHRGLHRLDRLRPPHEQRDHHVGEHHHVAQRQQRVLDDVGGRRGFDI